MGDLLLTSALYDDPTDGATVLHFAVPLHAPGVMVLDNWRTMAMRSFAHDDIEMVVAQCGDSDGASLAAVAGLIEGVETGWS